MPLHYLSQGDIIDLDFNPQTGHEQAGRRPALVISNAAFHRYTGLAILCPITNQKKDFPLHVKLDNRTRTSGEILCEHIKSLDYRARHAKYVERLPEDILDKVLKIVSMSIDLERP